jgi:hypothetical protein
VEDLMAHVAGDNAFALAELLESLQKFEMLYVSSFSLNQFFDNVLSLAAFARMCGDLIWTKIFNDVLLHHYVEQS